MVLEVGPFGLALASSVDHEALTRILQQAATHAFRRVVLRVHANSDGDGVHPPLFRQGIGMPVSFWPYVMEPTVEVFADGGGVSLGITGAEEGKEVQMRVWPLHVGRFPGSREASGTGGRFRTSQVARHSSRVCPSFFV